MKIEGQQPIAASIEAVWNALNDPVVLQSCIPGCQTLTPIGDNSFEAAATVKVGPITARFGGIIKLSDLDPPNGYTISGEGSGGAAGAAKGNAQVRLAQQGSETILSYDVAVDITGRLAQLGGKLIDLTAKQLAGVFFARFSEEVAKRESEALSVPSPAADKARPISRPLEAARTPPRPISAPTAASSATAWLLLAAGTLIAGFILGRAADGWNGAGALAGGALGLLIVLVAAAAFLFGRLRDQPSPTVRLDDDSVERLAAALRGLQS